MVAGALLASSVGAPVAAGAPTQPAPPDDAAQALAERFAPIVMLKQQDEACDDQGEPYRPGPVDIVLDNPEIALRQVGRDDPVVMRAPGAADLVGLGEGFFLDFPGSSLTPGCIYERDFWKYTGDRPATVYAHVVQQPDVPDRVFVQYWLYWYYNDWNNKHESDWEGITLVFDAPSVEAALAGQPVAVGYSQHEGGERADWDDDKLERDGDHPVVYSSAGSHASYFGSALYLGRSGSEGFGCDDTSGPSTRVQPEVILLPDSVDDPDDPLAWLSYRGRWGERQSGAFNGPTGPTAKARWLEPAPWFDELREASVVIPTGDSQAASVISVFCAVVERGSQALIDYTNSPTDVLLTLVVLGVVVSFLLGRTNWDPVPVMPIVRRRRAGQIIRSAVLLYARTPIVFVLFGLVYVPAAAVTGLLVSLVQLVPLVGSFVALAGQTSGTNLVFALLVGSASNLVAFVVVHSMVTGYLAGEASGLTAAVDAARDAWARRRDLAGALARSFLIVAALLMTVIGSPWGVRQLVRYQFLAQVVMLEGRDGHGALSRSSELVRGRWFHTALVAAGINGLVGLCGIATALVLLVVASGLPLWAFSALVTLVYALVVPLGAIAMTLLYGDAAAEHAETDTGEPAGAAPVGVA